MFDVKDDLEIYCEAILDGFEGACSRVLRPLEDGSAGEKDKGTSPRAILWLLVDHLLLLLQAPVYLTLTLMKGRQAVRRFSSLSEQDRAFFGLPTLAMEGPESGKVLDRQTFSAYAGYELLLTVWPLPVIPGNPTFDQLFVYSPPAERAIRKLIGSADGRAVAALRELREDYPTATSAEPTLPVEENFYQEQIATLRRNLDPILTSYGGCDLFPRDQDGNTRLFVATRQPFTIAASGERVLRSALGRRTASYGYTPRLILTPTQIRERGLSTEDRELLEKPLGLGDRAIADSPFTSGTIDIGFPGERDSPLSRELYTAPSGGDVKRKKLEDKAYGGGWRSESIFYVPIHLGGVPWLALFSFHPAGEASRSIKTFWDRYRIYRDLISTIGDQLSQAVAHAYADTLARAAITQFEIYGDTQRFVEAVNVEWSRLDRLFPYGSAKLALDPTGASGDAIKLSGLSAAVCVDLTAARPDVPYRMLSSQHISALIGARLQAAVELRSDTRREVRQTLMGLTVHEWLKKLADGIARSERLREMAFAANLSEDLMDQVYGLQATLQGDIGLPWVLHETHYRGLRYTQHFATRLAGRRDVEFLRRLFEFHVRAILGAGHLGDPQAQVQFSFTCEQFPECRRDCVLDAKQGGLMQLGKEIENLVKQLDPPWPLSPEAANGLTTREGLLATLTLGPRELLRNALKHGTQYGEQSRRVGFSVKVEVAKDDPSGVIETVVDNFMRADGGLQKHLDDVATRCKQIEDAVQTARCRWQHDEDAQAIRVTCRMEVSRDTQPL